MKWGRDVIFLCETHAKGITDRARAITLQPCNAITKWVEREGKRRAVLCGKDAKYKVSAEVYKR